MIDPTLPLTDLHRHLDGNIRPQTILELARQFNISLPANNLEQLRPHVQVLDNEPSLVAFLAKLDWGVSVLGDLEACRRIAYENVADLLRAGIDYAELRFSPYYMAMNHQLPLGGVVEAVIDGVQAGSRDLNVQVNLIGIMSRTFGTKACQEELTAILTQKKHMVAIDLAGDELGHPGEQFISHFQQVRESGLHVTVHAGEAAGSESIWQAIQELGATRIGHGVKAINDPNLMEYMAKHGIGIESCLTSNIQTSTVDCLEKHPIKTFLKYGIPVCLNTDDPAVEGIELLHEYESAAPKAGLSPEQLREIQNNGLELAFLSDKEKQKIRQHALSK
ncbi:adenosine deaminase [Vibrio mangrovi]|uniref:Adenosine deaminase n=1 Tax=Vibrio mangrovi TaxID=474394 RepID=A0A1Y6IYQ0_9VIBR|nr:adenosine deaminase [Vibrio mangrovi]MDW6002620.1 adenosine deaminase [Vibrio mangrovi]SMS02779.1 Aminodeoxyfutalosine deaminase [Vibrio mangrovi]